MSSAGTPDGPTRRPPRRHKTATTVAQRIVDDISRGAYPPGARLPGERDLLQQFQVGRGTLRESLRFLEMNGVLTVRSGPGGGPTIKEPDIQDFASTLGLHLELRQAEFGHILELRQVLEPAAAGLAAERASVTQAREISDSVTLMSENIEDLSVFLLENERFHRLVAVAAHNPVLDLLVSSMDAIIDGSRVGVEFPIRRRQDMVDAHRQIAEAISKADVQSAVEAMRDHMENFRLYTYRKFPSAPLTRLRWRDLL